MSIQIAQSIAKHFGITVSAEDAPKIIEAIQNAYATGRKDEREDCAISCEVRAATVMQPGSGTPWSACHECADAIRTRGQA